MLQSFLHKGLADLLSASRTPRVDERFHQPITARLDVLNEVASIDELAALAGFGFHTMREFNPTRYTIHVNGPWCITFEFRDGDAYLVDFEQHH
jgi:proteic killer suppression protein